MTHPQRAINQARAGEVPMKIFLMEEGERTGMRPMTIWHRIRAGKYPNVSLRKVNRRVVFVTVNNGDVTRSEK